MYNMQTPPKTRGLSMKTWSEYIEFRENLRGDLEKPDNGDDNVPSLNPSDMGEDSALFKITRLSWKNHRSETQKFFKRLAMMDPDIASEYQRLGDVDELPGNGRDSDKDEIYPSSADGGIEPKEE